MIANLENTPQRRFVLWGIPVFLFLWGLLGLHAYGILALTWVLLLVVAHSLASRGCRGLVVTRRVYPSAFEGDTVDVELVLENRGTRALQFLEVLNRFGPSLVDRHIIPEPGPLRPGTRRLLHYDAMCSRRWGIYKVGPIKVTATDPLGLYQSSRGFSEIETFAVFPQVYELAALGAHEGRLTLTPQEGTTDHVGQSLLYLGVRDYRAGDELRRIHWPATARRGELTVKEYESDHVPYLTLFLDLERRHRAGTGRKSTLEFVVRTGASLLWTACQRRHFVQLFADDGEPLTIPPGQGSPHLTLALHHLIQVQQEGVTSLTEIVRRSLTEVPTGSSAALVFATAPELEDLEPVVALLRVRRVDVFIVLIEGYTFSQMDQWPEPAADVEVRLQRLRQWLDSEALGHLILDAESDLPAVFSSVEAPA